MRVSLASLGRTIMVCLKSTKILCGTNSFRFFAGFVELYYFFLMHKLAQHSVLREELSFSWGHVLVFIYHITILQGFA